MPFSSLGCIMPYPAVVAAKNYIDAMKAVERIREFVEKTLPEIVKTAPQVIQKNVGIHGGAPSLHNNPGVKFFGTLMAPWTTLIDDVVEFGRMIQESKGGVLLDFARFLISRDFLPTLLGIPIGPLQMGMDLFLKGQGYFMEEIPSPTDLFRCMATLATFAVYPEIPDCGIPSPQLEITTEDVEDFAKDAAVSLVPALGLIL